MYVLMCRNDHTEYDVDELAEPHPMSVHVTYEHAKRQMSFNKNYCDIPINEMWVVEVECPDY